MQPACPEPVEAWALVLRDQRRELERLTKVDLADLPCRCFRDQQIAALERSPENGPRMPVGVENPDSAPESEFHPTGR